jgi:DNA-binding NarL/FixJ family response regulator
VRQTVIRVVVADDHHAYRQGLARLLRAHGIDVVAEAANGDAAMRAVRETAPDIVVMDLRMPGLSGLEATRRLAAEAPGTRVIVLSVSAGEDDVSDALEAGAHGYVLKDGPLEQVLGAIRSAATGLSLVIPAQRPFTRQDPAGP